VKDEKGVKIYFDPVSTKKRGDQARELCDKVCADPGLGKVIEPIGTIIYHVAAHEFGHVCFDQKNVVMTITYSILGYLRTWSCRHGKYNIPKYIHRSLMSYIGH
jgi:hypothetical protein